MPDAREVIAIVDDDDAARSAISILCRSVGLEPKEFSDISQMEAELTSDDTGCVVLDLRLPRLGGIPAVERVCSRFPMMSVVAISGYADARTVVRALRAGAVDFFDKPFSNQEFLEAVQAAVANRHHGLRPAVSQRGGRGLPDLELLSKALTRKQVMVLSLFGSGLEEEQIAESVDLHPRSVRRHLQRGLQTLELTKVDRPTIARLLPATPPRRAGVGRRS